MRATSVSGAASRAASSRAPAAGHGAVDGGEQAAVARAAGPCASSRLRRVAASIAIDRARGHAAQRLQRRHAALLGQLDIIEQRAGRRELGAAEAAEGVERGDAVEAPSAGGARSRCRTARRARRQRAAASSSRPACRRGRTACRRPAARRREPRQCGAERGLRHRLGLELAGRDIEPGEREFAAAPRRSAPRKLLRARVEQRVLGQRARRDQAHHVALDHRFGAALLGRRRILDLLADRDPEARAISFAR